MFDRITLFIFYTPRPITLHNIRPARGRAEPRIRHLTLYIALCAALVYVVSTVYRRIDTCVSRTPTLDGTTDSARAPRRARTALPSFHVLRSHSIRTTGSAHALRGLVVGIELECSEDVIPREVVTLQLERRLGPVDEVANFGLHSMARENSTACRRQRG